MKIVRHIIGAGLCSMLFIVNTTQASITDGVIDAIDKYAWSENAGFITFGEAGGNVHVTDSVLTGAAWSSNYGWISLNPASSGVKNDGNGLLSGQAWGEMTGWVDFTGVTIDTDGYFHGYANGVLTGQISFNCLNSASCASSDFKVRTDWRPITARPVCNNTLDDDGDGLSDYPADMGCSSISDTDETNTVSGGGGGGTTGGSGYVNFGDQEEIAPDVLHGSAVSPVVEECLLPFADIDGHWGYRYIDELYCLGIVSGRVPDRFVPDDGATRAEISKMALLMNKKNIDNDALASFPDIPVNHWAKHVIATGVQEGVLSGYGDGMFRPDQKVTRAELVKIFLLASGYKLPENLSYSFGDVPQYAWYYPYVSYGFSLNLLAGYADGLFRPDQEVTRAEAAKVAVYMLHLKD